MSRPAPPNVLWLTKGLGLGGVERLLSLAATHVDPARFHVEIAYLLPWKDAFVDQIRDAGVPVHCLGAARTADVRWVARLRRLVRSRDIALVHTHSPVPAVAARTCLGRSRPAIMHTEHNVWSRYRLPTYVTNTATYGRNAAVIAVSHGVADSVRRPAWAPWLSLPEVHTLHHGIDENLVRRGSTARAEARRVLGLADDAPVVGTVANFTPKKDQRCLLVAARRLASSHPGLRLVLVGSGPLEEDLRSQVRRDDLSAQVVFTGSRDDVQRLLPAFDVFALSSLHEGLPISLLEAMAAGVPTVATRVGGIPEAMTDGREGVLVAPQDVDALAEAIGRLLDDPRLRARMGAAAVETAGRFSITRAVDATQDLYDAVLATRAPAKAAS